MNNIREGEIFELYGYVPVVVISTNPHSQTITLIYEGGTTKVMYLGAFIEMAIRKLGKINPQFAQDENIINWALAN